VLVSVAVEEVAVVANKIKVLIDKPLVEEVAVVKDFLAVQEEMDLEDVQVLKMVVREIRPKQVKEVAVEIMETKHMVLVVEKVVHLEKQQIMVAVPKLVAVEQGEMVLQSGESGDIVLQ
tara:strand:+ start:149 stop:505 length:357 start_codon:yes stop_codon:yes gene_type:complete